MKTVFCFACCLVFLCCSEQEPSKPVASGKTTQPLLSRNWMKIEPGGDTACARGTPFHFWAKRGGNEKLLVYFLGGGACWDAKSCSEIFPYFEDKLEKPPQFMNGIFDLHNPENPFLDWNIVFIPYCTGDTHWGNTVHTYPGSGFHGDVEVHHKGFVNSMAAVEWIFDKFQDPDQIFLAGDSAGGYGSLLFAPYLMEHYQESSFVQFSDSAVGISTPEFTESMLDSWNVTPNIHPSQQEVIDRANNDPRSLTTGFCYESVAKRFPEHRFVQFNTVEDKTQKFFYKSIGGAPGEWNSRMEANISHLHNVLPNFISYTGWGDLHVALLRGIFYEYQVNGVRLRDFVNDLVNKQDMASVRCDNCDDEELYELGNPAAHPFNDVVQPYQDSEFRVVPQGSGQCGPASLYTIFHYYRGENVYRDADCNETLDLSPELSAVTHDTKFCNLVNGGKASGTSWSELKYAVKDLRLDCERQFAVELVDTKTELKSPEGIEERMLRLNTIFERYLVHKRPVIIHLSRSSWRPGHYMVLIGYNQETQSVYYADPNKGKIGIVSLKSFLNDLWYRSPSDPTDDNLAYWDGSWMGFYRADPENTALHDSPYDLVFDSHNIKKGLIVNGDDFGLSTRVNEGIRDGFENGILTSTSIQPPTSEAQAAYNYAVANPDLGVGIHLTLSRPKWAEVGPLTSSSENWSLVASDGLFPTSGFSVLLKARNSQVERELRAQIDSALTHGIEITHLDCHDAWCHYMDQRLDEIFLNLAKEYKVPVRWLFRDGKRLRQRGLVSAHKVIIPDANHKIADFEKRKQWFIHELQSLNRGEIAEIVLHPQTGDVHENQDFRVLDYRLVLDKEVMKVIADENISLVNYRILKEIQNIISTTR